VRRGREEGEKEVGRRDERKAKAACWGNGGTNIGILYKLPVSYTRTHSLTPL